jgi:uncharacterized membrane protein (DUF106 family)
MITFAVLFFIWVLYTAALGKFFFYLCDLPPAPLFDVNSNGIVSGFILALVGWIFLSVFVASLILEKVG